MSDAEKTRPADRETVALPAPGTASKGHPVMLALSTFRRSAVAEELAIEKARGRTDLVIVYVADVDLAHYLVGTEAALSESLRSLCEADILREHEAMAERNAHAIARRAADTCHIQSRVYVSRGHFAAECLKVVGKENPAVIVTTRSARPDWVRRIFGSPVDHLTATAGCQVITV